MQIKKLVEFRRLVFLNFPSVLVIAPTTISFILVVFLQIIRGFNKYPTYPVLYIVPFLVFTILALISAVTNICITDDRLSHKQKKTLKGKPLYGFIFSIVIVLISARFIGIVWGSKYLSPVFEAQYISGHAHIDTLFHSAITNMLIFFGCPSIGVEGVVPFQYHYGSHIIIAAVSWLLHLSPLQTYHLVYPTLILPLWVGTFLVLTEVIRWRWFRTTEKMWLYCVALIVFFLSISGIMPEAFRDSLGVWNNIIISESYAVSIMGLYIFATVIIKYYPESYNITKLRQYIVVLSIALLGGVVLTTLKISVGTLWCVGITFFWISDFKNVLKFLLVILSGIGWICILPFIQSSAGMSSHWFIGHFILTHVDIENISYYVIVNYGWTLLSLLFVQILIVKNIILQSTGRTMQIILGAVAVFGALPGLLIPIGAGSASYFNNVNVWVSIPLLAVLLTSFLSGKTAVAIISSNIRLTMLTLLLLFSPIITPVFNTLRSLAVFKQRTVTYVNETDLTALELWNILSKITQDKKHIKALEFDRIPPYGFRGLDHQRTWMTTYLSAAAISGIPTLNNIEETDQLFDGEQIGWGFDGLLINKKPSRIPDDIYTIHILHRDGKLVLSED